MTSNFEYILTKRCSSSTTGKAEHLVITNKFKASIICVLVLIVFILLYVPMFRSPIDWVMKYGCGIS